MVDNEGFVWKQEKRTEDFVVFDGLVSCFFGGYHPVPGFVGPNWQFKSSFGFTLNLVLVSGNATVLDKLWLFLTFWGYRICCDGWSMLPKFVCLFVCFFFGSLGAVGFFYVT